MEGKGYRLTRKQLLFDLYVAFYDAARHKHKMSYVRKFVRNLTENMEQLCDDLLSGQYRALPSKCFRHHLPEKARGVRSNVSGPHRSSSIFPLYTPAI